MGRSISPSRYDRDHRRRRSRSRSHDSRHHEKSRSGRHRHSRSPDPDSERRSKYAKKEPKTLSVKERDPQVASSVAAAVAAAAALMGQSSTSSSAPVSNPSKGPDNIPIKATAPPVGESSVLSNIPSSIALATADALAKAKVLAAAVDKKAEEPEVVSQSGPWELVLRNVYDASREQPPQFYEELEVEIGSECHRSTIEQGGVIDAKCDHSAQLLSENSKQDGFESIKMGGLRVMFHTLAAAVRCRDLMHGRWFDERRLDASVTGAHDNPPPMIQPTKKKDPPVEVVHIKKESNKFDRALAAIEVKISEDPKSSELAANRSGILGLLGRWSEALEAAHKAVTLDEKNGWAHYRRSEAYHSMSDYAGAVRSALKAKALDPKNGKFVKLSDKMKKEAKEKLDELDMISLDMEIAAAEDLEESNKKEEVRAASMQGKTIDIDEGHVDLGFQFNPAAHCYICKQRGHTKVDCPMRKCGYCFEMGHKRSDCPKLTEDIEKERQNTKEKKRKEEYAAKKERRANEWTEHLRDLTGISGHAPLYEILGLPVGKAASEADIKAAYKKLALKYHPDKNANAEDPAAIQQKFMEVKAAYELLTEGLKSAHDVSSSASAAFEASSVGGGKGGSKAVSLAVQAALSGMVASNSDSSLDSRAAELAKQRASSMKETQKNTQKGFSETDA